MMPTGMDRFTAAGIAATWWEESFFELKTAASRGWKAVLEAWLTTAEASQEDHNAPPMADQIAVRLLAASELAKRSELVAEHARLDAAIKSGDYSPAEIRKLKAVRTKAKRALKVLEAGLLTIARQTLETLSPDDALVKAIGELLRRVEKLVADHFAEVERSVVDWYDNLVNKYGTTLESLETERDTATAWLDKHLKELGYG